MIKRGLLAVAAVFVLWQVTDFVVHGILLMDLYKATAQFWRPQAEYKQGLMMVVSLISAGCFVGIYALLVKPRSLMTGLKYGLIFGLGTAITMGYGTYSYMPIPYPLAFSWFMARLVQTVLAGLITGWIVKPSAEDLAGA